MGLRPPNRFHLATSLWDLRRSRKSCVFSWVALPDDGNAVSDAVPLFQISLHPLEGEQPRPTKERGCGR